MAQLELLKPMPHHPQAPLKSDSAYRTISEVSEEIDVPQHVLRFWESNFPQVKPSRMRGSRRYYRPEDVDLLRKIKTLLYEKGFTIKGAKKFIRGKEELEEAGSVAAVTPPVTQEAPPAPAKKNAAAKSEVKFLINELRVLKAMLATLQ